VYHDVGARPIASLFCGVLKIERVGVVDAERDVKAAIGIERLDFINSFRNLVVTFAKFRAYAATGTEDWVGFDMVNMVRVVCGIQREDLAVLECDEDDLVPRPLCICAMKVWKETGLGGVSKLFET
jgi:hypothetical protein